MRGTDIRRIVLEQSRRAQVGHIGSCLSVADILATLFRSVLRGRDADRDRFVLSKGHAALALYAALHLQGRLTEAELDTFLQDGSLLGVHPDHRVEGIDFSTGSLGYGLSLGAGAALAALRQASSRRVFVLLSDAELNEGAVWEAAMFAAHHRLGNLTAIVDDNRQQALAPAAEVLDLQPLEDRWRAFGWQAERVDGHDEAALELALAATNEARPRVLLADTIAGKGVSFMERQVAWHYLPMDEAQYAQAMTEIGASV